jgi:NAD(P)H-flavin reductase
LSSGSGSGADPHLLALLRAIRLRQAAPDAVEAGAADAAAALSEIARRREDSASSAGDHGRPDGLPRSDGLPQPVGLSRPEWAAPHPGPEEAEAAERVAAENAGAAAPTDDTELPARAADFFGRSNKPDKSDLSGEGEPRTPRVVPPIKLTPPAAPSSGTFAERGPLLRPPGLPPIDPLRKAGDDVEAAPPGADSKGRFGGLGSGQAGPDPQPSPPTEPSGSSRGPHASPASQRVERAGADRRAGQERREIRERPSDQLARRVIEGEAEPGVRHRVPHFEGLTPPMVATSGRVASVDGMDPADDALLRQTQRLLSTSLTFAGGAGDVADRLREALHRAHPSLLAILPGDAGSQADRLAIGLVWLVHHLDQPPLLVNGCAALGKVLAEAGVDLKRLQVVGAALAEAMRAGMAPGEWRQEFDVAWRSTWQHLYEWIRHGVATASFDQTSWTAVVVSHELRRPDLAVIRVRPHLPLPFRPGQYARVEVPELPGIWRPYSLAGAPRRNDLVELHVRAKTENGVSGTLVYRTREGDRLRMSRPEGQMTLPDTPPLRDVLMIAGDTGVAPLKALLTELADSGDERSAVLFWGVRDLDELYDIDDIAEIARSAKRATVVPVVSEGDPGPYASGLVTDAVAAYGEWSRHEVYLAGPPLMLANTAAALHQLGVAPDRIHHDAPE